MCPAVPKVLKQYGSTYVYKCVKFTQQIVMKHSLAHGQRNIFFSNTKLLCVKYAYVCTYTWHEYMKGWVDGWMDGWMYFCSEPKRNNDNPPSIQPRKGALKSGTKKTKKKK